MPTTDSLPRSNINNPCIMALSKRSVIYICEGAENEEIEQVAFADRNILNKTDLVTMCMGNM